MKAGKTVYENVLTSKIVCGGYAPKGTGHFGVGTRHGYIDLDYTYADSCSERAQHEGERYAYMPARRDFPQTLIHHSNAHTSSVVRREKLDIDRDPSGCTEPRTHIPPKVLFAPQKEFAALLCSENTTTAGLTPSRLYSRSSHCELRLSIADPQCGQAGVGV